MAITASGSNSTVGGGLVSTSLGWSISRLYSADFKLIAKRRGAGRGKQPFAARFSPSGDQVAVGFYDSPPVNVLSSEDLSFLYAPATQEGTMADWA